MVSTQHHSGVPAAPPSDFSLSSLPVHLVLEVTRGQTRFRHRPVNQPRFLIGAGSTCDLRLGGERMPALHSIITVHPHEIHLEAIAAQPPLAVNGRAVQQAMIADGDVIGIGEVELLARLVAGPAPAPAQATLTPRIDVDRPVAELSAAELVELIEQEEREIEDFESRQRAGAEALVDALVARNRRAAGPAQPDAGSQRPIPAPHFLSKRPQILAAQTRQSHADEGRFQHDLEQLGRQLTALSHELKHSSERATEREAHYAAAADVLLDAQYKLVSQLEGLLGQVSVLSGQQQANKPRAIA